MTDQNRFREEGSRRAHEDEEQRRRRERQDQWRREHPGERNFGRDDASGRENRSYDAGSSSSRGARHEYAQGQGGYGGQEYDSSRYGQSYGGQRYGGQEYESPRYGGQGYGGLDYESQRHSGVGHSGLTSSPQHDEREGLYGRSGFGTQPRGAHRGKGPKGYKRSDDRIREDVCDRLSDDDELDASDISVSVKDGEVTLEGSVSDRRSKQRAEDLAEAVGGVRDVDNKLRKNKGMLQEMSERLSSSQNNERGYAGSGTKNMPPNASMSR